MDGMGTKEMNPLCVLDFYVHESLQRQGYGKVRFEVFLRLILIFTLEIIQLDVEAWENLAE